MMQNYIETHLPQYPCVPESLLETIMECVRNRDLGGTSSTASDGNAAAAAGSGLGHYEYFILFIVLAISAMTLTWRADHQARAASESFFSSASKHLHALQGQDPIQSLRISLLMNHYASMCPERADNWTAIANAVRIVLDLGLHKGCPQALGPEEARRRCQLFWVTYGMDRGLCACLRLPLSFPEESITTQLDFPTDDILTSVFATGDVEKRTSANHIYLYRALECEVHRVLHLEEDLQKFGHQDIDSWLVDINARLQVWYAKAQSYTQYNMLEFKHVQYSWLRARIHRPTPRLRTRTPEDRRIVLESTLLLVEDYRGQEHRRRLFYPWHGVHILFEAAIISLEACWSSRDWEPLRSQATTMLDISLPQCVQLLANIGERWRVAGTCADRLRPLVQNVASVFSHGTTDAFDLQNEVSITEEIHGLLFSDGVLTRSQPPPTDALWGFEDISTFPDDLFFEEKDFFEWNPEWDIIPADSV
ncbi:hypothetical protein LTR10_019915 [Elasticomyces elasticus]|uniref:Xylanolytic transcriptional activator regulatory domain-containing protein n=1 Tax=Exophiala sideris TaxID=1016849 RepID=A0ABR0J9J0_9EURO|nr:hypothetical protein LTR10_019915 [Elasticomyces elasticus]KAK5022752.1 hypothetical protein LTS07_009729 [Exophiala sideris]KAK5026654.1 hypothetical protein LTR13_009877 [Exophiala sideris]KAK5059379.1 hypothetical protein LTR69_005967 [Exophiala sideris]KAK5177476.1 hypothetical protein LTR44_010093 [Eurotiomycetes sp. CCFEE 6388]